MYFSHFRALYEYTWRSERLNFRLHYDNDDHLRVSCLLKRDDKAREKRPNLKMHLCWLFSISSGISDGYRVLLPKNGLVYFEKVNWTNFSFIFPQIFDNYIIWQNIERPLFDLLVSFFFVTLAITCRFSKNSAALSVIYTIIMYVVLHSWDMR